MYIIITKLIKIVHQNLSEGNKKMTKDEWLKKATVTRNQLDEQVKLMTAARDCIDEAQIDVNDYDNYQEAMDSLLLAKKNIDIDVDHFDSVLDSLYAEAQQLKWDEENKGDPSNEADPHPGYRIGQ